MRKLSLLEEFFIVLVRLKTGYFFTRFKWKIGHVCVPYFKIFYYMDIFFKSWVAIIFPFSFTNISEKVFTKSFQKYPTTEIIIDGTEMFVERATSMKTQTQTWSNYKDHNNWKALVGISTNGIVTFVSSLWKGRVSDKELTKSTGLLEKLEPGDNIMVDRGFDIADILLPGVTINIPPFKRGTKSRRNWWDS